jgi:hypothetical protein
MEPSHHLTFGPFCLDVTHGRLGRGEQPIALRHRSLTVLQYLVEHPGRLLTKAELRRQVWAGTHVTDIVLRVSIREIRVALGDSVTTPHYVETVGQEGYRFLVGGEPTLPPLLMIGPLVGRQGEVAMLEQWFQRTASSHPQLGFVSGEVGIGKTPVVDLFLERLPAGGGARIARGQCVEHYGMEEPYLPLLGALGRLSRGPGETPWFLDHRGGRAGSSDCPPYLRGGEPCAILRPPAAHAAGGGRSQPAHNPDVSRASSDGSDLR